MFDGIKICDLSVAADTLLQDPALDFTGRYSQTTGEIQTDHLTAHHRGLTFRLRPRLTGTSYRVEVSGSLHKYVNGGQHNADDFTAPRLLAALHDLTTGFGIDPLTSTLNNVEFGVNVGLAFPVRQVLDNLIHYKNRPFSLETGDGFRYHQCRLGQYVVKIYDKGEQYRATVPGLADNLLRFEVKVLKMEYLTRRHIHLNTLADLLTVAQYPALGALLVETFTGILFDEPAIDDLLLRPRDRDLLLRGRNPRHWILPDNLTGKDYNAYRQRLHRDEQRFRDLLDKHRPGRDWKTDVAALIGETWERLTTVTPALLTAIAGQLRAWENCHKLTGLPPGEPDRETPPAHPENFHKLTDLPTTPKTGEMSQIDHLDKESFCNKDEPEPGAAPGGDGDVILPAAAGRRCLVTGLDISHQPNRTRFLSATTIGSFYDHDPATFATLARKYLTTKQRATADLDKWFSSMAHNIRNTYTNPANNAVRRLRRVRVEQCRQIPLFDFDIDTMVREHQESLFSRWKGTRFYPL